MKFSVKLLYETEKTSGDGTTTSTVLARARFFNVCTTNISLQGASSTDIKRGIDLAVEAIVVEQVSEKCLSQSVERGGYKAHIANRFCQW